MKEIPVTAQPDHLAAYMKARPVAAVAELIWNALDAVATNVAVTIDRDSLGNLAAIHVADDGDGIPFDDVEVTFGNLGGSWKGVGNRRTRREGRSLHGRYGRGRFRAFALGTSVEWQTTFQDAGILKSYGIYGRSGTIQSFRADDPKPAQNQQTGTTVHISGIEHEMRSLAPEYCVPKLTEEFALYLKEYPNVRIRFEGQPVDPALVIQRSEEMTLPDIVMPDGQPVKAELTVIEWSFVPDKRRLYFCDRRGVALCDIQPGIQAPGYQFTAYLRSDYLAELNRQQHALELGDLHPGVRLLVDAAKERLKDYFRARAAEDASMLVKQWKEEAIYPYEGEAVSPVEHIERQVFDVCAASVAAHLKTFEDSPPDNKRFVFSLLQQAVRENPESLRHIFQEVLKLPKEQQKDLSELLRRTTLTAVIVAAKTVADRLNFIAGLKDLVFGNNKARLQERKQLHRMLAVETWIFGEQYNLSVDDQGLTAVLEKHRTVLLKGDVLDDEPVTLEDGSRGIVDLMLSRKMAHLVGRDVEHLVIELKRPTQKITRKVLDQVEDYARAVATDERFRTQEDVRWTFIALSNDMDAAAESRVRQAGRDPGIAFQSEDKRITIRAVTWAQVFAAADARLEFYKEKLQYSPDIETAREYLAKTHGKYLPSAEVVQKEDAAQAAPKKKMKGRKSKKPKKQP